MADSRDWTDEELRKMERKISSIYREAESGIREKWDAYMERAEKRIEKYENAYNEAVKSGNEDDIKKAKKELERRKENVTLRNEYYQSMIDETTDHLAQTNGIALDYMNDRVPTIYRRVYNWAEPDEVKLNVKLNVRDENTVKRMIKDGDIQLPYKKLDIPKDKRWNTKQLNSSVLQGILQGEDMRQIAKRIQPIVDNNRSAAVRNARTMVTGAENRGKSDRFKDLQDRGVVMKKVWIATPDSRTRDFHLSLDGQERELDEPFVDGNGNELMYPADPDAAPETVYNCRCSMISDIIGFRKANGEIVRIEDYEDTDTMHEEQIAREQERRETIQKDSQTFNLNVQRYRENIIANLQGYDLPDELRNELIKSINNLDNEKLLEHISNSSGHVMIKYYDESGTSHYTNGTEQIELYRLKEDLERDVRSEVETFWHEYGHYVDDARTSGSGYVYNMQLQDGSPYTVHGISVRADWNDEYKEAVCKDVNLFLERSGLSDRFEMTRQDEYSYQWLKYKETGEPVDRATMPFEDQKALSEALGRWVHEQSGLNKAENYLYDNGYPREPNWNDYYEAYVTPKRQIVRTREKYKGAGDEYREKIIEANEKQDAWIETHDIEKFYDTQRKMVEEAKKKEEMYGAITDTFDGGAYGFFMAGVWGGHSPQYYDTHSGGLIEGVANVFSCEVTQNKTIQEGFEDLCPNVYNLLKGFILE